MLDAIIQWINNKTIAQNNEIMRGITEYKPSEIGGFFPPTDQIGNIIISGGENSMRSQTIEAISYLAYDNNLPVVILHQGNKELETIMQLTLGKSGCLTIINQNNPVYEPFAGLSDIEISKLIIESAPKEYDIKPNARYYIDGMINFLQVKKRNPTLSAFEKCPHNELFNKVDMLITNNTISDPAGQAIKSKLMSGQSECFKLESYFTELSNQFSQIMSASGAKTQYSLLQTINTPGIVTIDIGSNINKLLVNVLIAQIKIAISKGKTISLITDELYSESGDLFTNFIKIRNEKCKLTISAKDIYALCSGDDKLFHTILGNGEKLVLFSHSSGASALKWAEAVGQYDKTEITKSHNRGYTHQNPVRIGEFATYGNNTSNTTNYNQKREYIIKPEAITRMQPNEVYIVDSVSREIAHTFLV
ncbi:hypothetical protein FACS1894163_04740 [Spirochaetia bacterium]|nr:hypothetical protein FACS1894163_04740 [Spirochaetia bacterium]